MTVPTKFSVHAIYQIYKDNLFGNAPVYMAQYPHTPQGMIAAQKHADLLQKHNDEEQKDKI